MNYPKHFIVPPTTSVPHRLAILEDLVALGAADPRIAELARELVSRWPGDPLAALLRGLHELVTYTLDPEDGAVEDFQRADYTLFERHAGDCEDMSVAYASMARTQGVPARAVWIEQDSKETNNHVPAQVCAMPRAVSGRMEYAVAVYYPHNGPACPPPNEWIWVETTIPGAVPGEHPYAVAERMGLRRSDLRLHTG